jgi:hypothetical protein
VIEALADAVGEVIEGDGVGVGLGLTSEAFEQLASISDRLMNRTPNPNLDCFIAITSSLRR